MKMLALSALKKQFSIKAANDKKLRDQVTKVLSGAFEIKDMRFTTHAIVLTAANKTVAQELFLRRESLRRELKRKIVIR